MNEHTMTTIGRTPVRGRRGVAMLMVVIALVVTTVLTTAIMTTPDLLGPVASNKSASASARWSASSASNFAVAAIEQEVSAADIGGVFKDDWSFAGGDSTAVVTNLLGEPPAASDTEVLVTVRSDVNGVSSTSQRRMRVMPAQPAARIADARLSDTSIHVLERLRIEDSTVKNWELSPRFKSDVGPISVGFTTPGGMDLPGATFDGAFCAGPDASDSFVGWLEDQSVGGAFRVPVKLPIGLATRPDTASIVQRYANGTDASEGYRDVTTSFGMSRTLDDGQYGALNLSFGSTVNLRPGTYYFDTITATGVSRIGIYGDVTIVVRDIEFNSWSNFFLDDGSKLRLYVERSLDFWPGYITNWDVDFSGALWESMATHMDPGSVVIEGASASRLDFRLGSFVIGTIHAPRSFVAFQGSGLAGRVTAWDLALRNSTIDYDPVLSSGAGFTNLRGPLYNTDGTPIAGLAEAMELNASADPDSATASAAATLEAKWAADGGVSVSRSGYMVSESTQVADFDFEGEAATVDDPDEIMKRWDGDD
ncbi:MAG: hypothetical protein AAGH64_09730 [Planctomycetota bacterium]